MSAETLLDQAVYLLRRAQSCALDMKHDGWTEARDALLKVYDARIAEPVPGVCGLCNKPLPEGEQMFKYHGYSGPCPTPESKTDG